MMIGRIDEVDGHFIATRFLALLVPKECVYVARRSPSDTTTTAGGTRAASGEGLPIQMDWRSVMLGYGRVWAPFIAIALPLAQAIAGGLRAIPIITWVLSATLLGVSVLAHKTGRLPEKEKVRLRLLGTITGLRIDPSRLQPAMREVKREQLGELMEKGGIPTTTQDIIAVIDDIPIPAMPLVYGFACYSGDDQMWRDCAALVYQRHEQGEL